MFTLDSKDAAQFDGETGSLDPRQKTVTCTHQDTPDQQYRFRHAPELRAHWLRLLPSVELNPKKVHRFNRCGRDAFVEYSPTADTFRLRADHCGNRICPACQRSYASKLARKVAQLFTHNRNERPKFLTLTLRPSKAPLADQVRHLKAFFRRLRATPLWKKAVKYGIAVVEVTRGKNKDHWHAHLHCVLFSDFMPQRTLSQLWRKITSGSYIVDIRPVKSTENVSDYVASYITKPPADEVLASDQLSAEWYNAVTKQHWVIRFGHRKLIPPIQEPERFFDWVQVCSLQELLNKREATSLHDAARALMGQRISVAAKELLAHVLDSC